MKLAEIETSNVNHQPIQKPEQILKENVESQKLSWENAVLRQALLNSQNQYLEISNQTKEHLSNLSLDLRQKMSDVVLMQKNLIQTDESLQKNLNHQLQKLSQGIVKSADKQFSKKIDEVNSILEKEKKIQNMNFWNRIFVPIILILEIIDLVLRLFG